ncbi:MAG TPA: hypothetical protein VF516_23000 [Kofleriaceae bacterium]
MKGDYRIIVDKRASAEERVTTLATALAQVMKQNGISPEDTALELPPKVREVLRMHEPGERDPARPAGRAAGGRTAA